jgi:CHASE2 domain-containing sensor protein
MYIFLYIICYIYILLYHIIPVVPHKAVAEVSKIGNLWERLVVVNQGWQSESTDGPKGA